MSFYVKLLDGVESKRRSYLAEDGSLVARRAKARTWPDRASALEVARRLREERKGCDATVCNEKGRNRPATVSELHPGTEQVATATGLDEDVVRALAGVAGCPVVRGGRGYRFASIEAFRGFVEGMTHEQRLQVPEFLAAEKDKLIEQIAKLTWGMDGGEVARLRRRTYGDLERMLAEWQRRDELDKARRAK